MLFDIKPNIFSLVEWAENIIGKSKAPRHHLVGLYITDDYWSLMEP